MVSAGLPIGISEYCKHNVQNIRPGVSQHVGRTPKETRPTKAQAEWSVKGDVEPQNEPENGRRRGRADGNIALLKRWKMRVS